MKYVNIRWAKTQIVKKLGYFPAYLIPALNCSLIFQSLVKQTLSSYINNPLPDVFKEKLFVFLSRYSGITYLTICHSCTLQSLGLNPDQILALGDINYPQTEADLEADLQILNHQWLQTENWQEQPRVEISLLRCCSLIFVDPNQAIHCSNILKSLLGSVLYNCLIIFLGYIKLCHQWIINHPEITHQQDPRSQLHLGSLLLSEIKLAEFFTTNSIASCQQTAISTWVSPNIKQAHIAQLKSVLIATKTGNWSWNLTSNKLSICHRGLAILGLDNFNGSYQSFLQSIHPEERESIDLAAIKSINLQQDLNLKCSVVKSNGEISQIQIEGKLYYNVQGKAIGLTGLITDISTNKSNSGVNNFTNYEQQQKVAQLKELEVLLNLVPYHLFVVDVATRTISLINSGLAKSLGLPNPQAAKNLSIKECFPPQYACQISWQQQQVLNCKQVLHLQEEVTLADGTHYFDTVITPLYNEQGEITTLLHTCSDIPDLAATQEALSQRTLQLEAANRELESFSYSVSHDLQAPLRVINGFSQVLWDNYQPLLDDHARHYLQRIQANSKRMSELIDALLQLSRVTRTQMQSAKVNLSEMAKDIIEELRSSEPQRQVEVMITPNLEVKGDPQLLRIALNNLLNNAWKYTSKRSLAKIEFTCHSQNQRPFTYLVRDNGAGFDKAYADKLFTAFQRLHSESEFSGTGIGLATVQRIIYRHGGKVWAQGASDQGATFYFTL
ncbi:PAS/PAC sensor signal transduction histidine kinase [Chondrocystis sp. NIES-4102]|nr:PAS/PAC sensor signal transduction histidine kinase [Chondrocystis sp. NIES-4102]